VTLGSLRDSEVEHLVFRVRPKLSEFRVGRAHVPKVAVSPIVQLLIAQVKHSEVEAGLHRRLVQLLNRWFILLNLYKGAGADG